MIIISGTIDELAKVTSISEKPVSKKNQEQELGVLPESGKAQPQAENNWVDWHRIPTPNSMNRRACYCCKATDFWQSALAENTFVCRKCHPPAPGAEMTELE